MVTPFKPAHGVRAPRKSSRVLNAGAAIAERRTLKQNWRAEFFAALAETSNVSESCKLAEVSKATVYDLRRRDATFAAKWLDALCEGYDNLEMDLLYRLRRGDADDAKYNYTAAIRILMRHSETVTRERAKRAHVSVAEVQASLDRKVAEMRALVLANEEAGSAGLDDQD